MLAAIGTTLIFTIFVGVFIFGAAGRLDLPMVWAYLIVYLAIGLVTSTIMYRRTPELFKLRTRLGTSDVPDRLYRVALGVGYLSHYVLAGLDIGRFHWSDTVPLPVQVLGLIGFAAGNAWSSWAALSNPFFTGEVRIQEERGQHVITAGPYQFMRHPGYTGGMLFFLTSGVALGSWLSILPMLFVVLTLIRRTALEDRLLQQRLPGYADYAGTVKFRLIPGVW